MPSAERYSALHRITDLKTKGRIGTANGLVITTETINRKRRRKTMEIIKIKYLRDIEKVNRIACGDWIAFVQQKM